MLTTSREFKLELAAVRIKKKKKLKRKVEKEEKKIKFPEFKHLINKFLGNKRSQNALYALKFLSRSFSQPHLEVERRDPAGVRH